MPKAIIPYNLDKKLPFAVKNQLRQLPENVQKDFLREYKKRSKDLATAYLLHLLGGLHYLYVNKIALFIFYILTFAGFGFWFLADLIRLPRIIREANDRIADDCLREVMYRHQSYQDIVNQGYISKNTSYPPKLSINDSQPRSKGRQPREIGMIERNPIDFQVEHLKTGFLLDYGLKTWTVKGERQYDWYSGVSEREFMLKHAQNRCFLTVWYEYGIWNTQVAEEVNLQSIQEGLDQEILTKQSPPNILHYGDLKFYRGDLQEGFLFDKSHPNFKAQKLLAWDYYDQSRQKILRIEQSGRRKFRSKVGFMVDKMNFTEILPSSTI